MKTNSTHPFAGLDDGAPSVPAQYAKRLSDGRIRCDLCPHHCVLGEGERGRCFVRRVCGGGLVAGSYGRINGLAVDPIEKKPLFHVLPGTRTLSFGAIGCNLSCDFCQNAAISQPRDERGLRLPVRPEALAETAQQHGCPSVAFTYNEPIVAFEFVRDAAVACRARGLRTLAVTAGYIEREPAREFFGSMDAANVDLKAFTEDFYRRHCGVRLAPVLQTLERIRSEGTCWLELTTLLIPGENDSEEELDRMTRWIVDRLGPDVPLHLTAFFPTNRLLTRPPTPPETLRRARDLARANGLRYVYTGNIADPDGQSTDCPNCGARLILREGYQVRHNRLTETGACGACGEMIPGLWR